MITIIDNVFTDIECQKLIDIYYKNQDGWQVHDLTDPINLSHIRVDKHISDILVEKLLTHIHSLYKEVHLDWGDIVHWPQGAYQDLHFDTAKNNTVLSSITYLNDEFGGGETYFEEGVIVTPKKGRTVVFNGAKYFHGVKEVLNGSRYTVAIWYRL